MSTSNTTATEVGIKINITTINNHQLITCATPVHVLCSPSSMAIQAIVAFGSSEYVGYHPARTLSLIELLDDFFFKKKIDTRHQSPAHAVVKHLDTLAPGTMIPFDYIFSFTAVPENGPSYKH